MREFDFLEPETLEEAVALLAAHGEEARVFAGGSALLLGMRQRMLTPHAVVSLGRLTALREIRFDPATGLSIGAAARHSDIARSEVVQRHYPMLAKMAGGLANPQVRNQGTIGGNLCYADPATDPPSCLIALGAEVTIAGPQGQRRLAMQDFAIDFFTTALRPGEVLTEIRLPPPNPGFVGLYRRQLRTAAEHRPLVNLAVTMESMAPQVQGARIVVGAATPKPQRLTRVEALLEGKVITLDLAADAGRTAADELEPISDSRGDAALRRRVVGTTLKRMLAELAGLNWKDAAA